MKSNLSLLLFYWLFHWALSYARIEPPERIKVRRLGEGEGHNWKFCFFINSPYEGVAALACLYIAALGHHWVAACWQSAMPEHKQTKQGQESPLWLQWQGGHVCNSWCYDLVYQLVKETGLSQSPSYAMLWWKIQWRCRRLQERESLLV